MPFGSVKPTAIDAVFGSVDVSVRNVERAVLVAREGLVRRDVGELDAGLDTCEPAAVDIPRRAVDEPRVRLVQNEREPVRAEGDARIGELRSRLERLLVVVPAHELRLASFTKLPPATR